MRRIVVGASVLICLLFLSNSAQAYHQPYGFYQQNYQYCYYYDYAYWQAPQLICSPYPATQTTYLIQPPSVYQYYYQVPPPPPPVIHYHFYPADQLRSEKPAPVLPPVVNSPKSSKPEPENRASTEDQQKAACLNAGLRWAVAGEDMKENIFVPDDPKKRHEEHLKRLGRYNWQGKHFEKLPQAEERYFGKEANTFTAPETGCYVRNKLGVWTKIKKEG